MRTAAELGDDRAMGEPDRSVTELILAGRDREAAQLGASRATAEAANVDEVASVADLAGVPAADPNGGPMDPLTQLDQLGPVVAGVVGEITPDQLDRPTPCADFTVAGVLEHMISGAYVFAAAFRGEAPDEPDLTDVLAAFGPALTTLAAAISAPGALDRTIAAPFGEVPGETFARFVVLDGLVHGWDLSTATGQPYDPPDALVAAVEAFARQALDPLRDGQTFGPPVEPAPDASPIERLAAYTGRHPLRAAAIR
jgi:uncharacterized protein (TIGR03086 family)